MIGWHHRLNGHEFEQTVGDSKGQGSLACFNPCSRRVGHDWATNYNQNIRKTPNEGQSTKDLPSTLQNCQGQQK